MLENFKKFSELKMKNERQNISIRRKKKKVKAENKNKNVNQKDSGENKLKKVKKIHGTSQKLPKNNEVLKKDGPAQQWNSAGYMPAFVPFK